MGEVGWIIVNSMLNGLWRRGLVEGLLEWG